MTTLYEAVEFGRTLGQKALYFGCWDRAGHFLHDEQGRHVWGDRLPSDLPWSEGMMDGTLLGNGKIADDPNGKVYWTVGGKALWYAFYWWDRSVDRRGACNSGFYVRGFGYPEPQSAFDYACSKFPAVVARQPFSLVLQNINRDSSI